MLKFRSTSAPTEEQNLISCDHKQFHEISLSENHEKGPFIFSRMIPSALTSVSSSPSYVLGSKFVTASLPLHLIAALSYALKFEIKGKGRRESSWYSTLGKSTDKVKIKNKTSFFINGRIQDQQPCSLYFVVE
jgi:hypothetical protein